MFKIDLVWQSGRINAWTLQKSYQAHVGDICLHNIAILSTVVSVVIDMDDNNRTSTAQVV